MSLTNFSSIARSEGDPRIEQKGPSSLTGPDRLARALGWFSVGLGVTELVAPGWIARKLGLEGRESLIRGYGVRELASAVPTLSVDKGVGLASRIGGDALDLGTLAFALGKDNPKRGNAAIATALVLGVTVLDLVAYAGVRAAHSREPGSGRDYSCRSGFPKGIDYSRGKASGRVPQDLRAVPAAAAASPVSAERSPAASALVVENSA